MFSRFPPVLKLLLHPDSNTVALVNPPPILCVPLTTAPNQEPELLIAGLIVKLKAR